MALTSGFMAIHRSYYRKPPYPPASPHFNYAQALKILFLDIDGVLNSRGSFIALGSSRPQTSHWSPVSVGLVAHLCRKMGLQIYAHSTWSRTGCDADYYTEEFRKYGHDGLVFLPVLPRSRLSESRVDRVGEAVRHYKPEQYVILDDDDVFERSLYGQNFVLCDFNTGFNFPEYTRALAALGSEDVEVVL